jgi:hypothetical protein
MENRSLRVLAGLVLATGLVAAHASPAPTAGDRRSFSAAWQSQGLQPVAKSKLDLLYVRPGLAAGAAPIEFAPVQVSMRPGWQEANRSLERARLCPSEEQGLKDAVGRIVEDELHKAFSDALAPGGTQPVLHAQVLDLYLNAPEMQAAVHSKTYTKSFGDMVLVAELRDGAGGPLLLGSWDHRPAREWATARLTTRVENAIEIRAAAHGWATRLRQEFDRLHAGG